MLAASDATGIAFVELLESLWGIPPSRLAGELAGLGVGPSPDERLGVLNDSERASVADYIARPSRTAQPPGLPLLSRAGQS
jgi:hypothetical protein